MDVTPLFAEYEKHRAICEQSFSVCQIIISFTSGPDFQALLKFYSLFFRSFDDNRKDLINMCGIVGYIGEKNAAEILVTGLEKLEYRGYDSAGIAVHNGKDLQICKKTGRLKNLEEALSVSPITGKLGIGHTRWATHGIPNAKNSHPHTSMDGKIAVVHNGIIENYGELREDLSAKGYVFASETDTEVIPHLIDYHYKTNGGDLFCAVSSAVDSLIGSFALGIICADNPETLIAARKDSPLIIALGNGENFIASDIPAILSETRDMLFLEDGEIAVITRTGVEITDFKGNSVSRNVHHITFSENAAQKDGYEHFMLKEIHEQPRAVADTLRGRLNEGEPVKFDGLDKNSFNNIDKIHIIACGSAYHAGLVGKTAIERLAKIPVMVELSSEYRYNQPLTDSNTLVIAISQSGETADTLAGMRLAKSLGARVLAITNVVGSTVSREASGVFYTYAGPEISVASTKAYATQLVAMYLFAVFAAETLKRTPQNELDIIKSELAKMPALVAETISTEAEIAALSKKIYKETDMYYLGRGLDYAVAMEGSLKLKEISYIHSETYAGGELKHGPIALIEDKTVVLAISCDKNLCGKMESNIKEVVTRGAFVVLLANNATKPAHSSFSEVITVPETLPLLTPLSAVAALQLLAYYVAQNLGYDIDKPRNLAKSVTVE